MIAAQDMLRHLRLLACLLAGACASLPEAPVPAGTPARVTFLQAPRAREAAPLVLGLLNRASVREKRPQLPGVKVCDDAALDRLLRTLAARGFFAAARRGVPEGPMGDLLCVESGAGDWHLPRPSEGRPWGRAPGEDLAAALGRFTDCKGLFMALYNHTYDLVPVATPDGEAYFKEWQQRAAQQGRSVRR